MTGSRSISRGVHRPISVAVAAFLASTMLIAALPVSAVSAADPPGCVREAPRMDVENPSPYQTVPLGTTRAIYVTLTNLDSVEYGTTSFAPRLLLRSGSAYVVAKFASSSVAVAPGASTRLKVYLSTTPKAKVGSAATYDDTMTNTVTSEVYHHIGLFRVLVVPSADSPECVRALPTITGGWGDSTVALGTTGTTYVTLTNRDSVECAATSFAFRLFFVAGSKSVVAKFAVSSVAVAPGASTRLKVHLSTTPKAKVGSNAIYNAALTHTTTGKVLTAFGLLHVTVVP
jgi:hypothetical protein